MDADEQARVTEVETLADSTSVLAWQGDLTAYDCAETIAEIGGRHDIDACLDVWEALAAAEDADDGAPAVAEVEQVVELMALLVDAACAIDEHGDALRRDVASAHEQGMPVEQYRAQEFERWMLAPPEPRVRTSADADADAM